MSSDTSARKPRTTYSQQQRIEILRLCQQPGASIAKIAQKYDIHSNTIYKWMAKQKKILNDQSSNDNSQPISSQFCMFNLIMELNLIDLL